MNPRAKKVFFTVLVIAVAFAAGSYFFRPDWGRLLGKLKIGTSQNSGTPAPREDFGGYKVVVVFDGDTLAIEADGKKQIVQAIGLNAPETGNSGQPIECFSTEATLRAIALLSGKAVQLKADANIPPEDESGRLLRYIVLPDGSLYNKVMIEEGFGYEYSNFPLHTYQSQPEFIAAQNAAKTAGRGLWAAGVCGQGH